MARWHKETCPACNKENYGITKDNGVGFCFNCGHWARDGQAIYKPRVRSEHIPEIRNLYAQAASYYHSSLDGEALSFLSRRGFTEDTIERFQIGYCPVGKNPIYRGSLAKEAGLATSAETGFLAGRITFPYFYDETTITDIRGRALDPNDDLRYKSPYNDSFFRGADYAYNHHLLCNNKKIILTEGEIKADIATQIQYPALALPGIMSWRDGLVIDHSTDYTVIFDSQRNMSDVRRAIMRVAEKLMSAGVNAPRIGTIPLFGKNKMDIDDVILQYGPEIFADIVTTALPYDEWKGLQRF